MSRRLARDRLADGSVPLDGEPVTSIALAPNIERAAQLVYNRQIARDVETARRMISIFWGSA